MSADVTLLWLRRDFRFYDHPAMVVAAANGSAVIPVFIYDDHVETLGAAPKWRLGEAVGHFADALAEKGSRLILRKGDPLEVLRDLIAQTGARAVHWSRTYDPASIARDKRVKAALKEDGITAQSHAGHLLFEPWSVQTGKGEPYKVYSPFWRAVKGRDIAVPLKTVSELRAPSVWPNSENLSSWRMGEAMKRGAAVVAKYAHIGEDRAQGRLAAFLRDHIDHYKELRDFPSAGATSGLSENLTYGEISPRAIWHAGWRHVQEGAAGAEHFLKELVWREFACHLLYHFPDLADANWRNEWNGFPWRPDNKDAEAWRRGMTGEPFVDAAMREMYVTGTMHNRARMIVASYLTKHLMTDWRVGRRWFEDCLIDWDPASNAMSWQWVAGSGPDAAPYFRVFNPRTQLEKFDKSNEYREKFIFEGQANPPQSARDFFDAIPRSWGLTPDQTYPSPIADLKGGRERALAAYQRHRDPS
ncbi:cryptochrome/photolyase family protein [Thioclava sp.]|uniref:cryptochrome/photolyase family protein n=1 Tax=Thioclava sp. TaxID=1933450 RepID=UPI003AA8BA30